MTATVRELLESRSVSKKGGKLTGSRSFHVYDTATPIQTPGRVVTLFGSQGLPAYGEAFPETATLFARDYELALVSGHNDLWLVRWDYSELEAGGGISIPEVEPGQPGYIEISANVTAARFPIWRSLDDAAIAVLTSDTGDYPAGDCGSPKDIGGISVDVNGEPLNDVIRQVEIVITEVRPGIPKIGELIGYIWKRNDRAFLGAPKGQLLYQGVSINRIDVNLFQYQHKFGLDRWYWMRQVPIRNALGDVVPAPVGIVPGPGLPPYNVAGTVLFVQGFPDKINFFNISPRFRDVD